MSLFFTHEQVSLEKNVDTKVIIENRPEKVQALYEIDRIVAWIKTNNFRRVCLQFPDHLLPDSVEVAFKLQETLGQPVYVMGDTAYESCCLDFIAAGHIEADALIHFGSVCFSQSTKKLPYLNIYEKHDIDMGHLVNSINIFSADKDKTDIYLLVDTPFIHVFDSIRQHVAENGNVNVLRLDTDVDYSKTGLYIFIGNNSRKMENIIFSLDEQNLYQYDPKASGKIVNFKENPAILKRRNYLSEKIKDSETFGIVMGTLAVDNYLKVLGRMKKLLKLNKKKFYVLSVGKISVAKLANFPEMDVFIVITCAMNEVYDSREFFKPIVTPFDVEKAFNPNSQSLKFTYDYNSFLKSVSDSSEVKPLDEPDVSLLTGKMMLNQSEDPEGTIENENTEISLKSNGVLVENSKFGAGYLANRSWSGLEQNLGQTEIHLAKKGRSGIAQSYSNEIEGEKDT